MRRLRARPLRAFGRSWGRSMNWNHLIPVRASSRLAVATDAVVNPLLIRLT